MVQDTAQGLKDIEDSSIHAWILNNHIRTEAGEPLDFHKYRFLYDIYRDDSPLICCKKAAQIGFTTYEILRTAYECRNQKIDILYVLPTADDVKRFSGGKTNKMIAWNPVLQGWTKDKDSVEQKQFGNNTIYYQGSWTERAALMITAKKLVVDEYDRCKPDIVEQYDSRLQSIADPKKAFFSNPSSPDFGVDKLYKLSDQKKWHITHSCGATYPMDEDSIDYEAQVYRCPSCSGEILDEERRMGEWKATAAGKWSGYWIPLWIAPWMNAGKIAEYKREKTAEYFDNFVAGRAYIGGGNKVAASTIINCLSARPNSQEGRVIIGVDTGLPIHYTLANKDGFFHYGKCGDPSKGAKPYEELEKLLRRFPKSIMMADQGGDLTGIRELQSKYPGRVFLVWYRADRKTQQLIQWGKDEEYGKVIADRNRVIQLFIDEMLDKRITFNGTESEWQEYIQHWMNIYRTWEENALGVREFKWERQGADHYCFVAGTKIATNRGDTNIEDIRNGDLVYTRNGYYPVYDAGLRREQQNVLTAYFSNGSSFTATEDHPVIHTGGKSRLDSLSRHAIMYECREQKYASITESHTDGTQTLLGGRIGFTSHLTEPTSLKDTRGSISRYGLMPLELSLRALSFIIKTKIRLITSYLTWCARAEQNTKAITQTSGSQTQPVGKGTGNTSTGYESHPMPGGEPKKVRNGIKSTLTAASFWLFPKYLSALSAVLRVLHGALRAVSSVPPSVVIVGLHENIEREDVINLSVEQEHEYFANGILVSNCHASIYARIGLDKFATTMAKVVGQDLFEGVPTGRIFTDASPIENGLYKGF